MIRRALKLAAQTAMLSHDPVRFFRNQGADIGDDVEIFGANVHTFGSEPYLVSVGNHVTISHGVDFITHDGGLRVARGIHPGAYLYGRIRVGDHCFLGAHCVLLPGSRVGAGTVIGSGSVVTGDVPPGIVAAGVPAKPIKTVEEYVQAKRHLWIDTRGLAPEAKRELLCRQLPAGLDRV